MIIKGINESKIKKLSNTKKEPKWMLDYRLEACNNFLELSQPSFGPDLRIDYDDIIYYTDKGINNNKIEEERKKGFDVLNKIDYRKSTCINIQYNNEIIYRNVSKKLEKKNIICCDMSTALKEHEDILKKYFGTIVKKDENKYTAFNCATNNEGLFIYIPPNTNVDIPFINYYLINGDKIGQVVRNLIIVDEGSNLDYTCEYYSTLESNDSIHNEVTEVYVGKNAKCKYITKQRFNDTIFNINIKRALVEENATMEWFNDSNGSKVIMEYPTCVLNGKNSKGKYTLDITSNNQISDIGAKMIHLAPNTNSEISCNSSSNNNGDISFRSSVKISKKALNSNSSVTIEAKILDEESKINVIPKNISENNSSVINYNSKIIKK